MKLIYRKYFTTVALIWAGCFILFFFAYMLVLVPERESKQHIEKQLAEKKRIYETALKATEEETEIWLNEQIERLRNRLKDFVIDFEDSANLTFDISQIANEEKVSSFSIKSRDDGRGTAIADCKYIADNFIDISFTAGFSQFATFLNALERHRPIIFVNKFTITRSEQDDTGHKVNMDLAVFVRKQQDS